MRTETGIRRLAAPVEQEMFAPQAERPEIAIRIDGIRKSFLARSTGKSAAPKRITALETINAEIKRGELVMLLGPSGCGKTTLLRIAAGLTKSDEGSITIEGAPVRAPRRDACMVFQHFGLLPWRTVQSNVEFPLELDGVPEALRREKAHELLALVGLERFSGHYPHEISGGMQQRVGIARALVRDPLVLFMDEPFGALDAQSREQLQDDFLTIMGKIRTTVIFVTHSIDEALVMADRIFVFTPSPGRIKTVINSPVASERGGNVRGHPEYSRCRAELRDLLRT